MMSLPFAMLGCALIAFTWLFIRPARAILPIMVLAIGYPFIQRTIAFKDPIKEDNPLTVFSYNVYGFYGDNYEENKTKADALMQYSIDYEADIKCFQEFTNVDYDVHLRTLSPMMRIDSAVGPINWKPLFSTRSAKLAFSLQKP